MREHRPWRLIGGALLGALLMVPALALAAPAPAASGELAATQGLIEAFKRVTPVPAAGGGLGAAQRQTNAEAFAALDRFFDFDRLVSDPLAAVADELTPEQRARFATDFRELVRLVAYPKSGSFFETARYELEASGGKGPTRDVVMSAHLEKEDLDTQATFHWVSSPAGFKLVDVSFDGASLIKDYRNQFGRIIGKEGVEGLLGRVAKRLAAERTANAGLL